jgi:hypothetical protein
LTLQRYLRAYAFCGEVDKLHVYSGNVGTDLLERLERTKLLIPKIRRQFPDSIARRLWLESHSEIVEEMQGAIEADGPRWDAACALLSAERRWSNPAVYGATEHPFDDPPDAFREFMIRPAHTQLVPWNDLRVDVSNDVYPTLFDNTYVCGFYSSWQVLLAAEVADAGVFFPVNFADDAARSAAISALEAGRAPSDSYSHSLRPVHACRAFAAHQRMLDAVVWYAEECERNLSVLLRNQRSGRFRLTSEEAEANQFAQEQLADVAQRRYRVSREDLVSSCQFLAERWAEWDRNGRPLVAGAYRSILWNTVQLLKQVGRLSFDEIRDLVGFLGGRRIAILDEIWPNWVRLEKQRVVRTLIHAPASDGNSALVFADVEPFVDFLSSNGLEAFFWRLRSFEEHAFGGSEYAVSAMKADLQGLAICVEHLTAALGATDGQLYENFKTLWKDPAVLSILRRNDVASLARQERLAADWPTLKTRIDALRGEAGGSVAADLVLAHRIRGGVHHVLPEDDQFELEFQFVTVMRAAALTFAEVHRTRRA